MKASMRSFQPPVYSRMNTERLHTPHYSPIWVGRSIPNRTVCFLYALKRSIQTVFWYVGQCPCYSTPLKFSSRCLFNTPIEIQDPDRGPSPPQAHGVPGWSGAGWHHERQGQLLADAGRVSGKGRARSGEARRHRQINTDKRPSTPASILHHQSPLISESCDQVWIYGFELWMVLRRFCIMFYLVFCHCTDVRVAIASFLICSAFSCPLHIILNILII